MYIGDSETHYQVKVESDQIQLALNTNGKPLEMSSDFQKPASYFLQSEEWALPLCPPGHQVRIVEGNILRIRADAMIVSHSSHFRWTMVIGLQPHLYREIGPLAEEIVAQTRQADNSKDGAPLGTTVITHSGNLEQLLNLRWLVHVATIIQETDAQGAGVRLVPTPMSQLVAAIHKALVAAASLHVSVISLPSVLIERWNDIEPSTQKAVG